MGIFMFFELYKWYQIAKSVLYILFQANALLAHLTHESENARNTKILP